MSQQQPEAGPLRLSVSRMKRQPRRQFTDAEILAFKRVADTLIPAVGGHLSGSSVTDFAGLITQASTILDARFEMLEALLAEIGTVADADLWIFLETLNGSRNSEFYVLSLIVSAAYLYSSEMKAELKYPVPHRNPAGLFEIADELGSGILDPVMERGPIFVSAD